VGGGITEVADIDRALRAGADKVSVNTAAVERPALIAEAAERFGSQCVVASIDARQERREDEKVARQAAEQAGLLGGAAVGPWYRVYTHGGRTPTMMDAVEWARQCALQGAGELLITSIDQDGRRDGYELELTGRIVEAVSVPVIASGGAGSAEHIRDALLLARADAALAAGIFHDGVISIGEVKQTLAAAGIPVRLDPPGRRLDAEPRMR
jgi:imidazole glycerol-phosphate synthase subunit HisF